MSELVIIRETLEHEHGQWTVEIESLPLTVGFRTYDECVKFCDVIMGASSYSIKEDYVAVTSFDNIKRYRVPNAWSLDESINKIRRNK